MYRNRKTFSVLPSGIGGVVFVIFMFTHTNLRIYVLYQEYDDGMYQAQVSRSAGFVGFMFRLFLSLAWGAFVYVPLVVVGYWVANQLGHLYSYEMFIKMPLTLVFAYVGFGLIYFLKGMLISLRVSGKIGWIFIWTLCVFATWGFQFFVVQYHLEGFLQNRQVANYLFWSWAGVFLTGILIDGHYKFLTNIAPSSVFPFFNGRFSGHCKNGGPEFFPGHQQPSHM